MNINEILNMMDSILNEKQDFQIGQFVYDTGYKAYGLIKELNGDTATIDFYRTKFGALFTLKDVTVQTKLLRDGDVYINKEISTLERKIQDQKNIKDEIIAKGQAGV